MKANSSLLRDIAEDVPRNLVAKIMAAADKIDRLEAENAALKVERYGLAATVSGWRRGVSLVDEWNHAREGGNLSDEAECLSQLAEWASYHARDRRPASILARRDARIRAELAEHYRDEWFALNENDLKEEAIRLRKQAEEMGE